MENVEIKTTCLPVGTAFLYFIFKLKSLTLNYGLPTEREERIKRGTSLRARRARQSRDCFVTLIPPSKGGQAQ